jgi:hypothetical protein
MQKQCVYSHIRHNWRYCAKKGHESCAKPLEIRTRSCCRTYTAKRSLIHRYDIFYEVLDSIEQ